MVNNSLLVAIVATSGTKLGLYFRFSKKKHNFALNKRNNSCFKPSLHEFDSWKGFFEVHFIES